MNELEICLNCERRLPSLVAPGSAVALEKAKKEAFDTRLVGCLDICNTKSVPAGIEGVNVRITNDTGDTQDATVYFDAKNTQKIHKYLPKEAMK